LCDDICNDICLAFSSPLKRPHPGERCSRCRKDGLPDGVVRTGVALARSGRLAYSGDGGRACRKLWAYWCGPLRWSDDSSVSGVAFCCTCLLLQCDHGPVQWILIPAIVGDAGRLMKIILVLCHAGYCSCSAGGIVAGDSLDLRFPRCGRFGLPLPFCLCGTLRADLQTADLR